MASVTVTEHYSSPDPSFLHAIHRDRRDGHRFLMSCLDEPSLSRESPRKEAKLLWSIDPDVTTLTVRRRADVRFNVPDKIVLKESGPSLPSSVIHSEPVTITGSVARQFTPRIKPDPEIEEFFRQQGLPVPPTPRARLQPVASADLNNWLTAKLRRLNFDVHSVLILPAADIQLSGRRRRESVPAAHFQAQVSGTPSTLASLLDVGFGRAKNYGLGLVLVSQPQ